VNVDLLIMSGVYFLTFIKTDLTCYPDRNFMHFFEQLLNNYTNFCLIIEENYLGSQSECNALLAVTVYKSCVKSDPVTE